ncbi:MAG TPA: hypothetical protein VFP14_14085 [Novosphingobium sp.]|nr:hypothetical protein [Novosphingobium sp.]
MMLTRSQARSIGWAALLAVCFALTVALSFRVNAVKSQVRLSERQIARLQIENGLLETEFETRSNQQQLASLNEVEFGYQAPTPGQYLESERQLAQLGKPRGPDAPPMIRIATADPQSSSESVLPAMVNPLSGKALAAEPSKPKDPTPARAASARLAEREAGGGLAERLSRVEQLSYVEKRPAKLAGATVERKLASAAELRDKSPERKDPAKVAKADPKHLSKFGSGSKQKSDPKPGKTAGDVTLAKAAQRPTAAKPTVHVALKGPAKPHVGNSVRVAID